MPTNEAIHLVCLSTQTRPQGIMLQIFIIILFRISPKSNHYDLIIPKMYSLFSKLFPIFITNVQLLQFKCLAGFWYSNYVVLLDRKVSF